MRGAEELNNPIDEGTDSGKLKGLLEDYLSKQQALAEGNSKMTLDALGVHAKAIEEVLRGINDRSGGVGIVLRDNSYSIVSCRSFEARDRPKVELWLGVTGISEYTGRVGWMTESEWRPNIDNIVDITNSPLEPRERS